jgi:hypothetical protein
MGACRMITTYEQNFINERINYQEMINYCKLLKLDLSEFWDLFDNVTAIHRDSGELILKKTDDTNKLICNLATKLDKSILELCYEIKPITFERLKNIPALSLEKLTSLVNKHGWVIEDYTFCHKPEFSFNKYKPDSCNFKTPNKVIESIREHGENDSLWDNYGDINLKKYDNPTQIRNISLTISVHEDGVTKNCWELNTIEKLAVNFYNIRYCDVLTKAKAMHDLVWELETI